MLERGDQRGQPHQHRRADRPQLTGPNGIARGALPQRFSRAGPELAEEHPRQASRRRHAGFFVQPRAVHAVEAARNEHMSATATANQTIYDAVEDAAAKLFVKALTDIPNDVRTALKSASDSEN